MLFYLPLLFLKKYEKIRLVHTMYQDFQYICNMVATAHQSDTGRLLQAIKLYVPMENINPLCFLTSTTKYITAAARFLLS